MNIDWSQNSTKRGLVWVIAGVVGGVCLFIGKADTVPYVITLASGVAGGLGVAIKD